MQNYIIQKGNINILLSAPHCVNHLREGRIKSREINTDTLLKEIYKVKKVNIIYKTESLNEDANYDEKSVYKEACEKFVKENNIKFFIDIHGMSYKRKEDICIGTGRGRNIYNKTDIVDNIENKFKDFGYEYVTIDNPFSAVNRNCVSSYISRKCGIPAVQIEINTRYRIEEKEIERLVHCMCEIIDILN